MKASLKKKINLFAFFLIAVLLLFFAFRGVDTEAIIEGFRNANYLWVFLALVVGTASHVARAQRWRLLIEPIGHKPSLGNTLGALMIGYVANIIFPRLGEITRCGTLKKTDNVPFEPLVGTVIAERAFDLLMLFFLLIAVFLIRIEFFGEFLWFQAIMPIVEKARAILIKSPLILVFIVVVLITIFVMVKRNVFGEKLHSRISSIFWGVIDGLKSIYTMKRRKEFIGYTLLIWFLYWLMTWLLVFSTEPTSHLGPIDGFFLLVVGTLGMAAPVQGGFGAFHIIIAMGLGIYGIERADGLVYAIISHESQTLLVVILGLIFMGILFFRKRKSQAA